MQLQVFHPGLFNGVTRDVMALICAVVLIPGDLSLLTPASTFAQDQEAAKIPADQLDSLVAPIALYPDQLMSQVLVASTYPLEVVQLQQWLEKNKNLKDKALADAVQKQDWDPSIQALAPLPDVAKYLADNIKWTTDLGNAFLAQQSDVMDAVQRMRKKAQDHGNLKSTEQQKVETKVVENKQVIVVQQASPEVVYVPSYNPTVVYGAPAYPYPPISYPPPGYYAAGMAISFGVGLAMGAAWGGGWGWNAGWGGNNTVNINNSNNFVNNSNRNVNRNTNRSNRSGNTWQHNPQHRGGAPYGNRSTADRFGGTTRGDSLSNRQANARREQGQRGNRQQAGVGNRMDGNRPQQASGRERVDSGRGQPGGGSERAGGNRNAGGGANRGGGGDRAGNRSVSNAGGSRNSSAFGGGGGSSGSSARSSSARGSSSMRGGSSGGSGSRSRGGGGGGGRRR
jgi:hypothetical protein